MTDQSVNAWADWALCAKPEHAERNFGSKSPGEISRCLQVCAGCSVREPCRAFADRMEDTTSVMGGEDPAARRARWRVRGRQTGDDS